MDRDFWLWPQWFIVPPRIRGKLPKLGQGDEKMSQEFASAGLTAGQLNAIVKMLGGEEGALRFLRGELVVSKPARRWREEDGVIYFTVTSDGTTGPDWITRLEKQGFRIGSYAKSVLLSSAFEPTNGVATKIAVLKGEFFEAGDRVTENIRAAATRSGFVPPSAEAACLIREMFTDKEIEAMGLWWIVIMHEPINDSDGDPNLLGAGRYGDGRWLYAYFDEPGRRWNRGDGFAFAVSQVSS